MSAFYFIAVFIADYFHIAIGFLIAMCNKPHNPLAVLLAVHKGSPLHGFPSASGTPQNPMAMPLSVRKGAFLHGTPKAMDTSHNPTAVSLPVHKWAFLHSVHIAIGKTKNPMAVSLAVLVCAFLHTAIVISLNPMPLLPPMFVGAVADRHRGGEYPLSNSDEVFRAFEFGKTRGGADGDGVFGFHGDSSGGGVAGNEV